MDPTVSYRALFQLALRRCRRPYSNRYFDDWFERSVHRYFARHDLQIVLTDRMHGENDACVIVCLRCGCCRRYSWPPGVYWQAACDKVIYRMHASCDTRQCPKHNGAPLFVPLDQLDTWAVAFVVHQVRARLSWTLRIERSHDPSYARRTMVLRGVDRHAIMCVSCNRYSTEIRVDGTIWHRDMMFGEFSFTVNDTATPARRFVEAVDRLTEILEPVFATKSAPPPVSASASTTAPAEAPASAHTFV